jgi:hypothetical protein
LKEKENQGRGKKKKKPDNPKKKRQQIKPIKAFSKNSRDLNDQNPVGPSRKRADTTKSMKSLTTTQQTLTFDGYSLKGTLKLDGNSLIPKKQKALIIPKLQKVVLLNRPIQRHQRYKSNLGKIGTRV